MRPGSPAVTSIFPRIVETSRTDGPDTSNDRSNGNRCARTGDTLPMLNATMPRRMVHSRMTQCNVLTLPPHGSERRGCGDRCARASSALGSSLPLDRDCERLDTRVQRVRDSDGAPAALLG